MSGISAAQYLKRSIGVVVYHRVVDGEPTCVVKQGTQVISSKPDDPWASLCYLTVMTLFQTVSNTLGCLRRYQIPPAALFFQAFNVDAAVSAFDIEDFVDNILPKLKGKTNYGRILKNWAIISRDKYWEGTMLQKLELFDWIVELHVLLRQEKGETFKVPTEGEPIAKALSNLGAYHVIDVTGMEACVAMLKQVHPKGGLFGNIFVSDPQNYAVNEFGYPCFAPPEVALELTDEKEVVCEVDVSEVVCEGVTPDHVQRCVQTLRTVAQRRTPEQQEFAKHGGHPELIDVQMGGLGKGALAGFKKIAGVGPVDKCISRLVDYVCDRLPKAPRAHVIDFCAGRIGNMQGDYTVHEVVGVCESGRRKEYHLRSRNFSADHAAKH